MRPRKEGGLGNVDGDGDFDANDSFLIHLIGLSGTDSQIDLSKGDSALTAAEIREAVAGLVLQADVDGDQDFDANDSFLAHLVKLSGTDAQIELSKGASALSASEIRSRIENLGDGPQKTSRVSRRVALADIVGETNSTHGNEQSQAVAAVTSTSAGRRPEPPSDVSVELAAYRRWILPTTTEYGEEYGNFTGEAFRAWIDLL